MEDPTPIFESATANSTNTTSTTTTTTGVSFETYEDFEIPNRCQQGDPVLVYLVLFSLFVIFYMDARLEFRVGSLSRSGGRVVGDLTLGEKETVRRERPDRHEESQQTSQGAGERPTPQRAWEGENLHDPSDVRNADEKNETVESGDKQTAETPASPQEETPSVEIPHPWMDPKSYADTKAIFELADEGAIALVYVKQLWKVLNELHRNGQRIGLRQEMEKEYKDLFYNPGDVQTSVVALSYPWNRKDHPDPYGITAGILRQFLEQVDMG
uniref:Transmembrane protein n=1 Tax=Chromera velia CCMP2878 TaxID=1169474 RepID=A0A0G4HKA6_9ALVE|eukprot:Cvel_28373.t1-p1 / transcript=Cvel_28373.t1 / gene=Cvel_28373 / organism=Chromera_velia_CCMP2878 / gene_product=hypothetical protein / transcript_product=hypothetical protein / location=Cvel_scaffold3700:4740-9446(+) / protein_length=269 / sequence_SO=supercontig / SO=protein_coding / is_pseudo=false